ncbi:cation:proton antiporter [Enterococcus sp.]|uniref:cation:proton antiporter n=1 Tax=Enterococcus sp. TaxID=35783 RepID=UPI002FCBF531
MVVLKFLLVLALAFMLGKVVTKFKMPAILGWLLAGMALGPHAFGLMGESLLAANWYKILLSLLECGVGLMIGTELVLKDLKKSGKQILLTTLTQSLGAFAVVTLSFSIIFYFTNIPIYLAFIFGSIALATAPAPALSIVREFKTNGPVTKTLIPMAVLDDVVALIVFFSINGLITATKSGDSSNSLFSTLAIMIVLPVIIGAIVGYISSFLLKQEMSKIKTQMILVFFIVIAGSVGIYINQELLSEPMINFMLIGMAFSAVFANLVSKERLYQIMEAFNPILGISLLVVIVNLGAPLDYHLILGAGIFTLVYIISRAFGKYSGAFIGAKATGMPLTVQKYLGLTLLPHSGVSLVFTGIAVNSLNTFDAESAVVIQGTIAAAAILNEIIAVIIAKKAFEWSGEMPK